jgi:uncharacterized protein with beta-barrel porin domain
MLDAANTQTSIVQNAAAQGAVVSSLTASLSNAVQAELEVDTGTQMLRRRGPSNPDKMPMAVRISAAQSSNKNASTVSVAGITAAVGLSDELTVGGFVGLANGGTSLSGFGFSGNMTSFGGFVRGTSLGDTGLTWKASLATSGGDVTIARDASLMGTEVATGTSALRSSAGSLELGYTIASDERVISPYLRLTHSMTTRDGYVEQAGSFPITYADNKQSATTATLGVNTKFDLPAQNTLRLGLGLDFDLTRNDAAITGTSQIPNMTTFSVAAPEVVNKVRLRVKMGISHEFQRGSSMSFDLIGQQNTYSNGITTTGSIGYTVQF